MAQERVDESMDFEPLFDLVRAEENLSRAEWNKNLDKLPSVSQENIKHPQKKKQRLSEVLMSETPTFDSDTELTIRGGKTFLENKSVRGAAIEQTGPVIRKKNSVESVEDSLWADSLSDLEQDNSLPSQGRESANASPEGTTEIEQNLPPVPQLSPPNHPGTETSVPVARKKSSIESVVDSLWADALVDLEQDNSLPSRGRESANASPEGTTEIEQNLPLVPQLPPPNHPGTETLVPVARKKNSVESVVDSLMVDMLSKLEDENTRSQNLEDASTEMNTQIITSLLPRHSPNPPETETAEKEIHSSSTEIQQDTETVRIARKSKNSLISPSSSPSAKKKRVSTVSRRDSRAKTPLLENKCVIRAAIEQPGPVTRKKSSRESVEAPLLNDMFSDLEEDNSRSQEELKDAEVINNIIASLSQRHSPNSPETETSEKETTLSSSTEIQKNPETLRTASKSRNSVISPLSSPSAKKKSESTVSSRESRAKTPMEQPEKATVPQKRQRQPKRCGGQSCGPPPCSSSCPQWKGDCANWLNSKLVTDKMLSNECGALGIKLSKKEKQTLKKNLNSFVETMMDNLSDNTTLAYGVFGFKDFVKEAKKLGCFGGEDVSPQWVKQQLQSFVKSDGDKKQAEGIIWPEDGTNDTCGSFDTC